MAVLDYRRLRCGNYCSIGLRRQTPRHLGRSQLGVLAWGLDTGIPATTVRATTLPYLGVFLAGLGFGSKWIGLAYAVGFLVPLWILCVVRRPANKSPASEPDWISKILFRLAPHARLSSVGMTCVGGLIIALSVLL